MLASVIAPIVDLDWLTAHRPEVVLADVRWYLDGRSGRGAYDAEHIPGAVFVDLDTALSAPADQALGRHPFPSPETFAAELGALGIGDRDPVIAYDDQGGIIAARLVWMLRAIDHDAALLDGGLHNWLTATGGASENGPPPPRAPARFTPVPWPEDRLADIDELTQTAAVVIDARQHERFAGAVDGIDPRAGHIPGARSLPCRENLGPDHRLLPVDALREQIGRRGVTPDTEVIAYCGSGVSACHDLLALEHAGLRPGRLFPGSWSQWSRDPDRPLELGPDPAA